MATLHWRGFAAPVPRKYTLTIGGTWATNDTVTIKIGGASLIVKVGSVTTTTGIAAAINAAINGTETIPGLIGDETRNANGQSILQFLQVRSTVASSVVTIVGTPGIELIASVSKVSTSGTATLTSVQSPSGPNYLNVAENYLENALPVDGDTIICDWGANSIWYGLDFLRTGTISTYLTVTGDYVGEIGLPAVNARWQYSEYLPRLLQLYGANKTVRFIPGSQNLSTHSPIRLDLQGTTGLSLESTHARGNISNYGTPNVFVYGGGNGSGTGIASVYIQRGQFFFDYPDFNLTSTAYGLLADTVRLGAAGIAEKECYVCFGETCQLQKATSDVHINGGEVVLYCDTKLSADDVPVIVKNGTLILDGPLKGYHTIDVHSGAILKIRNASQVGKIQLFGGTLNTDDGSTSCSTNNVKVYPGSSIYDKRGICVTAFDLVGCDLDDVTLKLGVSNKHTLTAASA